MSNPISKRLKALSPIAFENLIFDLVRLGSLQNATWRTPGADGGRDIEAVASEADFSGQVLVTKWLIECKRYAKAISWPVVWEKIAYGDSGNADYLLIAASTTFTPRCHDEIEKWNSLGRKPLIRVWPLNEIAMRVELNGQIGRKYGLVARDDLPAGFLSSLALHSAKMCQSASVSLKLGLQADRHIAAAAAISELMYVRSDDLQRNGRFTRSQYLQNDSLPDFVDAADNLDLAGFDRPGLDAVLASVYVVSKQRLSLSVGTREGELLLTLASGYPEILEFNLIKTVSIWGLLSLEWQGAMICLRAQIAD